MNIKRILVIRFSSLGDIILLTPIFRELKKRFVGVEIDFLTSTTFGPVCFNNPHINTIHLFDRANDKEEYRRFVRLLGQKKYDLIFDAHRSIRSRLLLLKTFGLSYWVRKSIVSIDKRSWKRNLLLKTKINLLQNFVSQREAYCRLLDTTTSDNNYDLTTELFPDQKDKQHINDILHQFNRDGKSIVALGPGASFPGKSWPREHFLDLAKKLQSSGFEIALLGGKNDPEPEWIESNSPQSVLNLAGKLSYLESAALLEKCKITVSNDSAIVHFSEAVGTPAISIFGPTAKEFGYGPYLENSKLMDLPLPCRPCSRNGKGDCSNPIQRQCLKEIKVDKVYAEILDSIGTSPLP